MKPADLFNELSRRLDDTGVELLADGSAVLADRDAVGAVLDSFCAVARLPGDTPFEQGGVTLRVGSWSDADLLRWEVLSFRGRPIASLTRQLTLDGEGEQHGMMRLKMTLMPDDGAAAEVAGEMAWGRGGPPGERGTKHPEFGSRWSGNSDEWSDRVKAAPALAAIAAAAPIRLQVDYGAI